MIHRPHTLPAQDWREEQISVVPSWNHRATFRPLLRVRGCDLNNVRWQDATGLPDGDLLRLMLLHYNPSYDTILE
jgi:hypothetical protein